MAAPPPTLREQLTARLLALPDVELKTSPAHPHFAGFQRHGKEFAHFHGPGTLDLRLTKARIRARRSEFAADPRVVLRRNPSDWLEIEFRHPRDIDFVVQLVDELLG
ncbi:MAG TPA: luciferase family protein [bacterium]|nr:luciferase family protein [bacterium]